MTRICSNAFCVTGLHDHLQVMGIEKIYREDATLRKLRESYWISTLGTMAPTGMNIDD